jgi:hypothetical protein
MKYSYTFTCPKGHPAVSYAPNEDEEVRCKFVSQRRKGQPPPEPCDAQMQRLEANGCGSG